MKWIGKILNKKRYFIVFYTSINKNGNIAQGNSYIETYSFKLFNMVEYQKSMIQEFNLKSIVITNFIELSKIEFKELYKK